MFRYLLPDEERGFICVAGVAIGVCSLPISCLLSPDAEEATCTNGQTSEVRKVYDAPTYYDFLILTASIFRT